MIVVSTNKDTIPHLAFSIIPIEEPDPGKLQAYIDENSISDTCCGDKPCLLSHVDDENDPTPYDYESGAHMCFISVALLLKLIYSTTKMDIKMFETDIIVPTWHRDVLKGLNRKTPLISKFDIDAFKGGDAIVYLSHLLSEGNHWIFCNLFKENTYTVINSCGDKINRHDVMDIQLPRGSIMDVDRNKPENEKYNGIYNQNIIDAFEAAQREYSEECGHKVDISGFNITDFDVIRDFESDSSKRGIMFGLKKAIKLSVLKSITQSYMCHK